MLFDFFNKRFYVQKERIAYRYFYVTTCPKDFGKLSDGVTQVALDVVQLHGRVLGVSAPDYLCSTPIGLIVWSQKSHLRPFKSWITCSSQAENPTWNHFKCTTATKSPYFSILFNTKIRNLRFNSHTGNCFNKTSHRVKKFVISALLL